jgi:hypothetical protein
MPQLTHAAIVNNMAVLDPIFLCGSYGARAEVS